MGIQFVSSLLIFVVGVGIGVLLQRYILGRRNTVTKMEAELTQMRNEKLQTQDSLQQHFDQTAQLANSMTDSYKALYDHLAKGSDQFTSAPLEDLRDALSESKHSLTSEPNKNSLEEELTDQALDEAGLVREADKTH